MSFLLLFKQVSFTLIPDAQVLPLYNNHSLKGGQSGKIYLAIGLLNTNSSDWECNISFFFFERYRIRFDYANNRVGLAPTPTPTPSSTLLVYNPAVSLGSIPLFKFFWVQSKIDFATHS